MQNKINNINKQKDRRMTLSILVSSVIVLIGIIISLSAILITSGGTSRSYDVAGIEESSRTISAKISTMESDTATMNMLIKEAINTSKAGITSTVYGSSRHTAAEASVADICQSNDIGQSGSYKVYGENGYNFFCRNIGGKEYRMVYTSRNNVELCGPDDDYDGFEISGSSMIRDFEPDY